MTALILIVVLIALIIVRVPVSFAILATGIFGLLLIHPWGGVNGILETVPVTSIQNLSLSAIPLFILMAYLILMSGLLDTLFDAARTLMGRTPGGTGMASAMAGVGFAAVSGSSTAAAAALAKTSSGRMIEEGYKPTTATGVVASVGTLAGMIPPSIILVFYAVTAQASVGDLIIAGIVPGIIIALALMLTMFIPILLNKDAAPRGQRSTGLAKVKSIAPTFPVLAIILVVVGAIMLGIATPTESASLGVLAALALVLIRRRATLPGFIHATIETVKLTAMIFAIMIAAHVFGYAFAETKVTSVLVDWVQALPVPPIIIMLALMLMYLVLGFFMDQAAIIALTVPVVLPIVVSLGYDAVWFGIFVVLMGEIGLITPPLGLNVFVVAKAANRDVMEVFRGTVPYAGSMLLVAVVFVLWPGIVTWLPNLV